MTKIKFNYNESNANLSVKGHSGYNKRGNDIVCSAISILVYTFLQTLKDYETKGVVFKKLRIDSGNVEIKASFNQAVSNNVLDVCKTVYNGFLLLEGTYADNVNVIKE